MRVDKLIVGNSYRHKSNPTYCWAKVLKVLKPLQDENDHNYIIVKCEYSQMRNDKFGLIKYFKPCDLVEPPKE